MAKSIYTSSGFEFLVDDEDYETLVKYSWCNDSNGYAVRRSTTSAGKSTTSKMHRIITNAKPGEVVDHINGNPFDNRKRNLRIGTQAENKRNCRKYSTNTTGYKGVSVYKSNGNFKGYSAQITYEYKKIHLGTFSTKEEAAVAYNKGALKYFGEYAKLNEMPAEFGALEARGNVGE